ncbi:class I SAM-dependent methyltransferase [Alkaliphilus peptidifermentans]|uniref:Methyltransferase domain-containing protein n=1 Tax=Alkaliphilus peptidifermentans DSM 18978 TaxID=1120976 RepID=A0A1G5JF29_9FIRM|nr:class I SAM-dependent methyltransferase [Alkaliphilus peptidifermentans]SCY86764.1 Methyltransferase domain-containing protein [Alkaliphilus peptidifermentans DSM 18978]
MEENAIRPSEYREINRKLHDEDIEDLMSKRDEFIYIDCPTCSESKERELFNKKGFRFVECNCCKTIFINPRPSVEMLTEFYANSRSMKYWNEVIFPQTENNRKNLIVKKRADRIIDLCNKYNNDLERIVDVGAGFGTFCEVIKDENIFKEVIAVEPSDPLAKTCLQKNIKTFNMPIEDVSIFNISVMTCFEVIEHLFDPNDFLRGCHNKLNLGGLLFITTPNIEGFEMSMLMTLPEESYTPNLGGPDHLNYFSPSSLTKLLENNKFEVLEILTPGELDVDIVRQKFESEEYDFSQVPIIKNILMEYKTLGVKFQQFLADNKLSSHMWAVARKY